MQIAYRASTIRAAEQATGLLESGALMQRAAAAVAAEAIRELKARTAGVYARRVLLVVGAGDNGRDGLFAAERLRARGVRVDIWRAADVAGAVAALESLPDVDLVIDAVVGLSGRAGLREPVAAFARAVADVGVPVLSVDLPSGVVADSCAADETFVADVTVTFGALRLCHLMEPARSRCGRVVVADIGLGTLPELGPTLPEPVEGLHPLILPEPALPRACRGVEGLHPLTLLEPALPRACRGVDGFLRAWELADLTRVLPIPDAMSSKYGRGVVGLDTGSEEYIGAGILSATGAVYGGAGMVRFMGPRPGPVRLALPNIVVGEGRVQAWLLGSGWGSRDGSGRLTAALESGLPAVLDADALQPTLPRLHPQVVLTPHAGELARLLGWERALVEAEPLVAVDEAVRRFGATVLLKGATQYVQAPDFSVTTAIPGPGWTGQAGSGDVLAGVLVALLGGGVPAPEAALAAASLQALAAERCWGPVPPQDVAREIPAVIRALLGRG